MPSTILPPAIGRCGRQFIDILKRLAINFISFVFDFITIGRSFAHGFMYLTNHKASTGLTLTSLFSRKKSAFSHGSLIHLRLIYKWLFKVFLFNAPSNISSTGYIERVYLFC